MSHKVSKRQQAVNSAVRRSRAGAAFNDVLSQIIELNRYFTTAAEALTKPTGQTLARWLVLQECEETPATVSDIARRLHLARQSVQRVADDLERDALCAYRENPRHQRAKLLDLTPKGRSTLVQIQAAQREWSNALGAVIGERVLRRASAALAPVIDGVERDGVPYPDPDRASYRGRKRPPN
jgi:DNA-binding MarR family transcriptional regulator